MGIAPGVASVAPPGVNAPMTPTLKGSNRNVPLKV